MNRLRSASAMFFLMLSNTFAVTINDFLAKTFTAAGFSTSMQYRLFVPKNYTGAKAYPMAVYLHGVGERGSDNTAPFSIPFAPYLYADSSNQARTPCFVCVPQCPNGVTWAACNQGDNFGVGSGCSSTIPASEPARMVIAMIDSLTRSYSIDTNRIYLTGLSMGGFGTFDIGVRYSARFAALVPCCGGGDGTKGSVLAAQSVWAFHGGQDGQVSVQGTRDMIAAIKAAGGFPLYHEFPEAGHGVWGEAYAEPDLFDWTMWQNKIRDATPTAIPRRSSSGSVSRWRKQAPRPLPTMPSRTGSPFNRRHCRRTRRRSH